MYVDIHILVYRHQTTCTSCVLTQVVFKPCLSPLQQRADLSVSVRPRARGCGHGTLCIHHWDACHHPKNKSTCVIILYRSHIIHARSVGQLTMLSTVSLNLRPVLRTSSSLSRPTSSKAANASADITSALHIAIHSNA